MVGVEEPSRHNSTKGGYDERERRAGTQASEVEPAAAEGEAHLTSRRLQGVSY